MSVRGKKQDDWVAVTLTDFGEPGRREALRHHYTLEAAYRAWHGIVSIYGITWGNRMPTKVWQETREGEVINAT